MRVFLQNNIGFCSGLKRAVALASEVANTHGKVYALGQLLHNEATVSALEKMGVITRENWEDIPPNSEVLIRSHGVGEAVMLALQNRGMVLHDATCPSVKKIHVAVHKYSQQGYHILILGKPTHPEVVGIRGWCEHSSVVTDAEHFLFPNTHSHFFCVAQTTLSPEVYQKSIKILEESATKTNKTVVFYASICYTTIDKQASAKRIASKCDTVLVVGDQNSSNTLALLDIAKQHCARTYLVSNVSELGSVSDKKSIAMLGIIAGASAPKELIMEVINRMDQENKVDGIITDEVAPIAAENDTATELATQEVVTTESTTDAAPAEEVVAAPAEEVAAPADAAEPVVAEDAAPAATEEAADSAQPANEFTTYMKTLDMRKMRGIREGAELTARIISVDATGVSVTIEGMNKNDSGFIASSEMEIDGSYNPDAYEIGSVISVMVIPKTDSKMKATNLSKRAVDEIKIQDEAVKKILEGEEFTLACHQTTKGGLIGKLGSYTIFVPASQIRTTYVNNLEDFVGKKLRLRAIPPEANPKKAVAEGAEGAEVVAETEQKPKRRLNDKRIVASQRVILEEEKQEREEAFWEVMQVNNIIRGKVKRFATFGAFVSIMGKDCLAHIGDLSWTKISDPSEVLEINKSYDFVVLKTDRENNRVSLGYRQLQKKPYELAAEKYAVGDVVKGKVERLQKFGAFIEIEPGVDGLVHVSEIGHKWIADATEALKVGEEIEAKIIGFSDNKITLSMKALVDAPASEMEEIEGEVEEKRAARLASFQRSVEGAERRGDKRDKRPKKGAEADSGEPRDYVSSTTTGATFADLFKDLDMDKFSGEDDDEDDKQ